MAITDPTDPLKCYCGKVTKIYDSLFRRNFCSDECSTTLRIFLGGTDKTIDILAGDFRIRGSTVTLSEPLIKHQQAKAASIDKIDSQIQAQLAEDKERASLKKLGLADAVIDAMMLAKKGA